MRRISEESSLRTPYPILENQESAYKSNWERNDVCLLREPVGFRKRQMHPSSSCLEKGGSVDEADFFWETREKRRCYEKEPCFQVSRANGLRNSLVRSTSVVRGEPLKREYPIEANRESLDYRGIFSYVDENEMAIDSYSSERDKSSFFRERDVESNQEARSNLFYSPRKKESIYAKWFYPGKQDTPPSTDENETKSWVVKALSKIPILGTLLSPLRKKTGIATSVKRNRALFSQNEPQTERLAGDSLNNPRISPWIPRSLEGQENYGFSRNKKFRFGISPEQRNSQSNPHKGLSRDVAFNVNSHQSERYPYNQWTADLNPVDESRHQIYSVDRQKRSLSQEKKPSPIRTSISQNQINQPFFSNEQPPEMDAEFQYIFQLRKKYGLPPIGFHEKRVSQDVNRKKIVSYPGSQSSAVNRLDCLSDFNSDVQKNFDFSMKQSRRLSKRDTEDPFLLKRSANPARIPQKRNCFWSDYLRLARQAKFHSCKWIDYFDYIRAKQDDAEDTRLLLGKKQNFKGNTNRVPSIQEKIISATKNAADSSNLKSLYSEEKKSSIATNLEEAPSPREKVDNFKPWKIESQVNKDESTEASEYTFDHCNTEEKDSCLHDGFQGSKPERGSETQSVSPTDEVHYLENDSRVTDNFSTLFANQVPCESTAEKKRETSSGTVTDKYQPTSSAKYQPKNSPEQPPDEESAENSILANRAEESLFGKPAEQSLLGKPAEQSLFGKPAEQSLFGKPAEQSLFGKPAEQSLFGKPAEQSLFGKPAEQSLFGKPAGQSLFEKPAGKSLFEKPAEQSLFEKPAEQSLFGKPAEQSLFGKPAGESIFGKPAGESIFGKPAGESIFGKPAGQSLFGKPGEQSLFGKPAGQSLFAKPTEQCLSETPLGQSLFGKPVKQDILGSSPSKGCNPKTNNSSSETKNGAEIQWAKSSSDETTKKSQTDFKEAQEKTSMKKPWWLESTNSPNTVEPESENVFAENAFNEEGNVNPLADPSLTSKEPKIPEGFCSSAKPGENILESKNIVSSQNSSIDSKNTGFMSNGGFGQAVVSDEARRPFESSFFKGMCSSSGQETSGTKVSPPASSIEQGLSSQKSVPELSSTRMEESDSANAMEIDTDKEVSQSSAPMVTKGSSWQDMFNKGPEKQLSETSNPFSAMARNNQSWNSLKTNSLNGILSPPIFIFGKTTPGTAQGSNGPTSSFMSDSSTNSANPFLVEANGKQSTPLPGISEESKPFNPSLCKEPQAQTTFLQQDPKEAKTLLGAGLPFEMSSNAGSGVQNATGISNISPSIPSFSANGTFYNPSKSSPTVIPTSSVSNSVGCNLSTKSNATFLSFENNGSLPMSTQISNSGPNNGISSIFDSNAFLKRDQDTKQDSTMLGNANGPSIFGNKDFSFMFSSPKPAENVSKSLPGIQQGSSSFFGGNVSQSLFGNNNLSMQSSSVLASSPSPEVTMAPCESTSEMKGNTNSFFSPSPYFSSQNQSSTSQNSLFSSGTFTQPQLSQASNRSLSLGLNQDNKNPFVTNMTSLFANRNSRRSKIKKQFRY